MKPLFAAVTLAAAVVFSVGFSACSTWGTRVPMGDTRYPKVPISHVVILFGPPQDGRPYEQIGVVSSLGGLLASEGDMLRKLQMAAASLGADAVIVRSKGMQVQGNQGVTVVNSNDIKTYWDYPKDHGIAIKYK